MRTGRSRNTNLGNFKLKFLLHVYIISIFVVELVPLSVHRAFKINELKTEVTNRLAMLEKRVERKCASVSTLGCRSGAYQESGSCTNIPSCSPHAQIRLCDPVTHHSLAILVTQRSSSADRYRSFY